jgi:serpin B
MPSQQPNSELTKLVNGNTAFAIDLYKAIAKPGENLFFSPYSISIALAMTLVGARGETEQQMKEVMHLPFDGQTLHREFAALAARLKKSQQKGHVMMRSANALYPQDGYDLLPSFLKTVKAHYAAAIESVDYVNNAEGARLAINQWVLEQTEHKIHNLIPSGMLNALTHLLLVNAIYFKGDWQKPFDHADTQTADFWVEPDRSVKVEMMGQTDFFAYGETEQMQMLELPYGDRFSMLVLLPKEGHSIEDIETTLSSKDLNCWNDRMNWTQVDVKLLRFKLDQSCSLTEVLQHLGLSDAFNSESANFSGMTEPSELWIGQVIHKAMIEVNEEGSEAAAATAAFMLGGGSEVPAPNPRFIADRPFLFLIQENSTRSTLFMGKLASPIA